VLYEWVAEGYTRCITAKRAKSVMEYMTIISDFLLKGNPSFE
jgi:hypothetical protein